MGSTSNRSEVDKVIDKLERCAERALEWANKNAVQFEPGKTEPVLFSKKTAIHKADIRKIIRVCEPVSAIINLQQDGLGYGLTPSLTVFDKTV
jgi:hypothetical protein